MRIIPTALLPPTDFSSTKVNQVKGKTLTHSAVPSAVRNFVVYNNNCEMCICPQKTDWNFESLVFFHNLVNIICMQKPYTESLTIVLLYSNKFCGRLQRFCRDSLMISKFKNWWREDHIKKVT